jgi:lipid-A-disaccharide synthase
MGDKGSIFISAGDPSADFPGKNLIDEIRRTCPEVDLYGLGGPLMQASGMTPLADYHRLAVMGFWEVMPQMLFFRRLLAEAARQIEKRRPKVIILVDYPGFNLRLAARVKHLGIPIVYYISPQVWAWGKRRIAAIRKLVDLMLVIFPFEEEFFATRGIPARFTGHPLVDRYRSHPDKATCREQLGCTGEAPVIALLPGSRVQEVARILPVMVRAADLLPTRITAAKFYVAAAEGVPRELYQRLIGSRPITILEGKTPALIKSADCAVITSGTATLEAAYFGTPLVVVYKAGWLTYQIARRLVEIDAIGMVNIVAGRRIVPELIQHQATGEAIADEVAAIMGNQALYAQMVAELGRVRELLGSGNAGRQAFEALRSVVSLC